MDEIKHFGVLGMRWGVRKSPSIGALKRTAKYEGKVAKRQKGIAESKAFEQSMIKSINSSNLAKRTAKVKQLAADKKSEADTIKEFHAKSIDKLKKQGKYNADVGKALNKKLQDELKKNNEYWDKDIKKEKEKIQKDIAKNVKELKENKNYWDEQAQNTTVASIKQEDLTLGLTAGVAALGIVGSIALQLIYGD